MPTASNMISRKQSTLPTNRLPAASKPDSCHSQVEVETNSTLNALASFKKSSIREKEIPTKPIKTRDEVRSQYDCIQKNISKFNQNYLKETWKTPELKINTLAASAHVKYDVSKIEVN